MSWQFDDKPLLTHLFSSFLPLSLDLQRLIVDYLYRRELIPFEKNGIISYLRLGPTLITDQIVYEIRAYNERGFHVFSTFKISDYYLDAISLLRYQIITEKEQWHKVFLKHSWYSCYRYVFSPVTRITYQIGKCNANNTIRIQYYGLIWDCEQVADLTEEEVEMKIIEYCKLVEKHGEELEDYLKTVPPNRIVGLKHMINYR